MKPKPYKMNDKPGDKANDPLAGNGAPQLYTYADYVKEYWVVNPKAGVTVFLLQDNGKFDDGTTYDIIYTPDAKVPVHTIKGLEIDLKELFED